MLFFTKSPKKRVDSVDSVDKTPHLHALDNIISTQYPVRVDCVDDLQTFWKNETLYFLASIVEEKM